MIKTNKLVPLNHLSIHYQVEPTFFNDLRDIGLIEITTIKRTRYIHRDKISDLEKIIRLHHELAINIEGIDVIFNLLRKLESRENELSRLRNRLRLYEH